jgi:hypothetical protein
MSIVVEHPYWQGASLHLRHLLASLTASYIVIRGVSLSQSPHLEHPLQWGVLLYSSEYYSLILVFLNVGLEIVVGIGSIISFSMFGENLVKFLEPQPAKVLD